MTIRNVVTLSHLDPKLHEWAKEEAKKRSLTLGRLVEEALRRLREKEDKGEASSADPRLN